MSLPLSPYSGFSPLASSLPIETGPLIITAAGALEPVGQAHTPLETATYQTWPASAAAPWPTNLFAPTQYWTFTNPGVTQGTPFFTGFVIQSIMTTASEEPLVIDIREVTTAPAPFGDLQLYPQKNTTAWEARNQLWFWLPAPKGSSFYNVLVSQYSDNLWIEKDGIMVPDANTTTPINELNVMTVGPDNKTLFVAPLGGSARGNLTAGYTWVHCPPLTQQWYVWETFMGVAPPRTTTSLGATTKMGVQSEEKKKRQPAEAGLAEV
jgi:hypothetical protein